VNAFADIAGLEPHRIWEGVVGRVVHGDRVTLSVVELDPDCVIPDHRHENEQLGMIALGSLNFRVGDEVRELGPGGTWRIPANVPHEVRTGPRGRSCSRSSRRRATTGRRSSGSSPARRDGHNRASKSPRREHRR
jgi:quercetin dioxygenase-like cupin family protein